VKYVATYSDSDYELSNFMLFSFCTLWLICQLCSYLQKFLFCFSLFPSCSHMYSCRGVLWSVQIKDTVMVLTSACQRTPFVAS